MDKGLIDEMGFTGESIKFNYAESSRVSSILSFLENHKKLDLLSRWNSDQLIVTSNQNGDLDKNTIRDQLKIKEKYGTNNENLLNYFTTHQHYDVTSFDYMITINQNLHSNQFNPQAALQYSGNFDFAENKIITV